MEETHNLRSKSPAWASPPLPSSFVEKDHTSRLFCLGESRNISEGPASVFPCLGSIWRRAGSDVVVLGVVALFVSAVIGKESMGVFLRVSLRVCVSLLMLPFLLVLFPWPLEKKNVDVTCIVWCAPLCYCASGICGFVALCFLARSSFPHCTAPFEGYEQARLICWFLGGDLGWLLVIRSIVYKCEQNSKLSIYMHFSYSVRTERNDTP